MDLEAHALVGHNIVGDMKVLDRVDLLTTLTSSVLLAHNLSSKTQTMGVYPKGSPILC